MKTGERRSSKTRRRDRRTRKVDDLGERTSNLLGRRRDKIKEDSHVGQLVSQMGREKIESTGNTGRRRRRTSTAM